MILRRLFGAFFIALTLLSTAVAGDQAEEVIKAKLHKLMPTLNPDRVEPSVIPGIYEVYFGTRILYITKDAKYVLQGTILDTETREDIAEAKLSKARLKLMADISEEEMIVYSPKQVKHTVTVFTDIDCPYCRKMHLEVNELNKQGVKVRYLLMPRAGKGSASYKKAIWSWCAKDKNEALTKIKAGGEIEHLECKHPVDKHLALAEVLGITGTPSIIMENGQMLPGYMPAKKLVERIQVK